MKIPDFLPSTPLGSLPAVAPQRSPLPLCAKQLAQCCTDKALSLLAQSDAVKLGALPLALISQSKKRLVSLAVCRDDLETKQALRFALGMEVQIIVVPEPTLQEAIFLAYNHQKNVDEQHEQVAATYLQTLLEDAFASEVSDVHLLPLKKSARIRFRVHGILKDYSKSECSKAFLQELINRVKVLAQLHYHDREQPQDGAFTLSLPHRECRIRVSTLPTVCGEKLVLRLPSRREYGDLHTLGLSSFTQEKLRRAVESSKGAILFCGSTGSGKTTTMYALIEPLLEKKHVLTIEDPVEYELAGATQVSVCEKQGKSFSALLRAALRQDPEVLVLGEMRDRDSATTALQAALTGHLVLSTVHARSVIEVFLRLKELGLEPLTLAQGITGIVGQQLIPRLCAKCRVIDLLSSKKVQHTIYQANGCQACGYSGYSGRFLVEESLFPDSDFRKGIIEGDLSLDGLSRKLREEIYRSMAQSLEQGLRAGMLDVKTVKMVLQ